MAELKEPRIKIERARRHLAELTDMTKTYVATQTSTVDLSQLIDGEGRINFTFHQGGLSEQYGAVVGDIVHNLRAALDIMACELVRLNGQSDKHVYFPFADSEANLEGMIKQKHFDRAGESAVELLRSFAPYRGGNDGLRGLHDLDIQDKHKSLIPQQQQTISQELRLDGSGFIPTGKGPITTLHFPADSTFAGDEIVTTLGELVQLTEEIVEAFEKLPSS